MVIYWAKSIKKSVGLWITLNIFVIFLSTVSGFISTSAFASFVCVPVNIASSAVEIKICAITAGIKKVQINYKEKEEKAW